MNFDLTEEQAQLRDAARKLAQQEFRAKAARWDREELFPEENKHRLAELGYLGLSVDKQFGGMGAGLVSSYLVIEELAKVDLLTAMIVHDQNVSPRIIANHAPEELKRRLVPRFVTGELECSIAWTEPQAGSDGTAIRTAAVRDGDEVVINGSKIFTTFGDRADMHLVYARFGPSSGAKGIGTIVVERDRPGLTVRKLEGKMGVRGAAENELFFDNVRVPASNLLGEQNKGFIYLMEQLPQERLVIALRSAMVLETQLEASVRYTGERKVFGNSILSFQNSKFKLAEAKAYCGMLRVYIDDLVRQHVQQRISVEQAACAKLVATELMGKYLDELLQLHGGYGYSAEYGIGRAWVDARVARIAGGASEVLKDIISRQWHGLL